MVERTLESVIASDVSPAFDLSMRLLAAGGKRIRPALMILAAMATGECDPERLSRLAAAAELVHMASLVHDDVVDETRERRGAVTAAGSFGNKISVLGGDYLLSRAFQLLAIHATPDIMRSLSTTAVHMSEGEMLQAWAEGDPEVWQANYWRIIRDKTAGFMGACCECGALLVGSEPSVRERLCEYGVQVGLAFQIADDVLDIVGDRALTGKQTGMDLMDGKFTLPVLLALRDGDGAGLLREMLAKGRMSRSDAREAADMVVRCGAVDAARLAALDCAERARAQLSGIAASEYTRALDDLAHFVVCRQG
jgi:octaprenyl-diphosphate synthase